MVPGIRGNKVAMNLLAVGLAARKGVACADSPERLRRAAEWIGKYVELVAQTPRQDQEAASTLAWPDGQQMLPMLNDLLNDYADAAKSVMHRNWLNQAI